jgi:hypothetical protein
VKHTFSVILCAPRARSASLLFCFLASIFSFAGPWATSTRAQGSRKDDVVFNSRGQPLAGAQIRVCTASATTTPPCTPTASVYSDVALSQALANPLTTDGMGNYNFYAAPGRYVIEISGPGITTRQLRDVILPNDPSQPATFSGITTSGDVSAFTLSLAGNLTVAGSTAVTGSLTVGGAPVPSTAVANTWTAMQTFQGPSPWRDVRAYGAVGNGSTDDGPAFNAAIAAAEADPGGTVYVSSSAHAYLINTCLVFAASHGNWLHVIFAGTVTWGSGCPTQNIHTATVEFSGQNSGFQQDFDRGSAKASLTSSANATFLDVFGESIIFRGLDIRCNASPNTNPCVNYDNNGTSGSSVYLDMFETNVANSGTGVALLFNGLPNPGGFGGRIFGGTFGSNTGCTASIKEINWGAIFVQDATLTTCGFYAAYQTPSAAPSGNIELKNVLYEGGTTPFLTIDSGSSSGGAGLTAIKVDFGAGADIVSNGYLVKTLGASPISDVTLDNSSGGSPAVINQSAQPISGLFIRGLFDYIGNPLESDIFYPGSTGHLEAGTQNYLWSAAAQTPAWSTVRGGAIICQGATTIPSDASIHLIDCTNGSNGIGASSLPGGTFTSTSSLVTREDSTATHGTHTFESPNGGSFALYWCRVTGGCPGQFYYDHSHDAFAILAGGNSEMYIGDSLGGVAILRGFQFLNGGANALTLGGSFSAARSQSFQDANGTIALTSQLPLSGTTSSIGGSSLAAGACTSGTATVTSSTTSMAVAASPAADPGAGFTWNAFVSAAGTVTVRVCNVSGANATPTASAYNVRVVQ